MRFRLLRTGMAVVAIAGLLTSMTAAGNALVSADDATPIPGEGLPAGPLGEQMRWLVEYLGMPAADAAAVDLTSVFAPAVLQQVPAEQLATILGQVRDQLGPVTIVPESIITTRDSPPTNARFLLAGRDGVQLPTTLNVDPVSGMIDGIFFEQPIVPAASPIAQAATPDASPFPDSAIGRQAAWTLSTLQADGRPVPVEEIESHSAPSLLAVASAQSIADNLAMIQQQYGPFTLVPGSVVVSANEPPTNLSYGIEGANGTRFVVSITIDPDSELLTSFLVSMDPTTVATPAASLPPGIADTELTFQSGPDTLYGSFMAPADLAADAARPAALIISGSGPTDRDGNSGGLPLGTNRNVALTLAEAGIPSFRYDKLGSGKTGLGSHGDGSGVDYRLYLQEARDAAATLAAQPGVDPSRSIVIGHSEGAIFALALADELTRAGTPPAALILMAPLSIRYLDLLDVQLTANLRAGVEAGQMTEERAAALMEELHTVIDSLRTEGRLPSQPLSPELAGLFSPANIDFLVQIDAIDPRELAAALPSDLPVLVLLGNKDAQVTGDQVRNLLDGFRAAGNDQVQFAAIPKADHTFRIVEGEANPAVDYANPDLEFAPQAVAEIVAFLTEHGLLPS